MASIKTFVGCIFIAPVDEYGVLTGNWESPGEAYPLTLNLAQEIVKKRGRTCLTNGAIIGTKTKPADSGGSLTLHEFTASNLAKALKGLVTTNAVSETTLSAEPVTVGSYGEYVEIGYEDLSSVVVQDATDTTTYVEGTDYRINTVLGLISPIDGGSISESDVLHISCTAGANTDKRVTIGAGSFGKYAIKGHLIDEYTNDVVKLYIRKALITSSADVNFVSDESAEEEVIEFALAPEIPTGQTDYGTIDGLPL